MSNLDKYLDELTVSDEDKIKIRTNVGGAVVVKEGDNGESLVLLIQRAKEDHWPNFWEIPRGGCDFGKKDKTKQEPIIPCVQRECKEECGLDVVPIKMIDKFSYVADQGTRLSTQHNFLCEMKNPDQEVKLSHEHQDYKWVQSVGEVELYVLPEIKKTISKALNPEEQIVIYPENELSDDKISEVVEDFFEKDND